jgi:twitching motility protein PilT
VNLLDSLLDAIVRLDGDALVMHVGEKPYVVTTSEATNEFRGPLAWGQVELSSRVLTVEAVNSMLGQILPIDQRAALTEYGATEYEVQGGTDITQRFTIVAARGGDDIWLEVRRHPKIEAALTLPPVAIGPARPEVPVESAPTSAAGSTVEAVEPQAAADFAAIAAADELSQKSVPVEAADQVAASITPHVSAPFAEAEKTVQEHTDEPVVTAAARTEPQPASEPGLSITEPRTHATEEEAPLETITPLSSFEEEIRLGDRPLQPEDVLLAADADWSDDVMTEGDLNELLRASAAAIITGKDNGPAAETETEPETPYELTADDASLGMSLDDALAMEEEMAVAAGPNEEEPEQLPFQPEDEAAVHAALLEEGEHPWPAEARATLTSEPMPAAPSAAMASTSGPIPASDAAAPRAVDEPAAAAPRESTSLNLPAFAADTPTRTEATPRIVTEESTPILASAPTDHPFTRADVHAEHEDDVEEARPTAVVLPLSRHVRPEPPVDVRTGANTLERVLHLAAARGAATVYVIARSAPMVRIDGEFSALEGEPSITTAVVERLTAELAPHGRDAASGDAEWTIDVPEIGRVRCMTFRDHRGPGLIFRMVPQRAISADQLGLPAEVQALCSEADGLVLVAGGRGSGRSTLLTSFVDLINRTRSEHVITAESQIEFLHENKRSFISQREVRGDADAMAAAVRAAAREEPDVLIIEDLRTPELVTLALEGAQAGRLVFASVPAPSAVSAIERMIEMFPAERREKAQVLLASVLRGVVSQVLLRKLRGGRIAAREVLLSTPAIANLIREGKTFQLPAALESGRRFGMMPLAESLATLVREGTVHPSHAYRKAPNREQFLGILRRDGVDTSIAERLA